MNNPIFFNSSMPRACSTLLQNIFNQNPDIHATPTDGLLELLYAARGNYTNSTEFKAQDRTVMERAWKQFCKGGLKGYCSGLTDRPIVCLKSRGYGIHYKWFEWFMDEKPKMICMVRDLKGIIASMEQIHRQSPQRHSNMVDYSNMNNTTTMKRVVTWLNTQPIGLALERIHQMLLEGIDKDVLFIRAEDLTSFPLQTMDRIYSYLGLPYFVHNFNNIEQTTVEDDEIYGIPNLHKISNKLHPIVNRGDELLGTNICKMIDDNVPWYQKHFNYIK